MTCSNNNNNNSCSHATPSDFLSWYEEEIEAELNTVKNTRETDRYHRLGPFFIRVQYIKNAGIKQRLSGMIFGIDKIRSIGIRRGNGVKFLRIKCLKYTISRKT